MTHPIKCLATLLTLTTLGLAPVTAPTRQLQNKDATLSFTREPSGLRPRVTRAGAVAPAASAVVVQWLGPDDAPARATADYETVEADGAALHATATVRSAGGGVLEVVDTWTAAAGDDGGFDVARVVTVNATGTGVRGFGTGLEWAGPGAKALSDADVFVPGMWYATDAHTPPSALTHDVGQTDFLLREDRMALPLVSLRDRRSGWGVTLTHRHPDGSTIAADDTAGTFVDERLRFASLGLRRDNDGVRVALRFPGSEGEQTSIFGFKPARRTFHRFHPVKPGATQQYNVRVRLSRASSFPEQLREAWRAAWADQRPEVVPFDAAGVYDAGISVLAHYAFDEGKVSGVPFAVSPKDGVVRDPSLQMGFVGQQLPCASYLIDEGLRRGDDKLVGQGERMADFWVRESLSPAGVPRTWYDMKPEPQWRNYDTYLRVVTDGTSGLLRAWQIERTAGRAKPEWLKYCRAVGDWLLRIQNADGSFFRSYGFDGKVVSKSKTSTLHPVRLLVDLSCATGDMKYRRAAERAAAFALKENVDGATYVGGTPDNPDVTDKEAGWIAFDSYLALYDVTREKSYLDAAVDAADFTETWIYGWNVPVPADARDVTLPKLRTTAGFSLIATGHSGTDVFLAYASLSYLRLSLYTGDPHFADIATLLQHNSAQLVDVNGSLGYARPGLLIEAFSLAVRRGQSVGIWLPWCTSAVMEPMARCREVIGEMDVAALERETFERRHREAMRNRGFGTKPQAAKE